MLRTLVSNKKNGWGNERDGIFWEIEIRRNLILEYINMDCDGYRMNENLQKLLDS